MLCALNVAKRNAKARKNSYRQGNNLTSLKSIFFSDTNKIEVKRVNEERQRDKREEKNRDAEKPLGLALSN